MGQNIFIWLRVVASFLVLVTSMSLHSKTVRDGNYSYELEETPGWVEMSALDKREVVATGGGYGTHVLLSNKQVNLLAEKRLTFFRYAFMPKSAKGVEELSEIKILYSPDYNGVSIHTLNIHRNGEVINKLKTSDIKIIQREEGIEDSIYSGTATMLIVLSDVRVGDVIEYSFTRSGHNPVLGDKYFGSYSMGWYVPADVVDVRVIHPKGKKIFFKNHGFSEKVQEVSHDGYIEKKWIRQSVPAVRNDGELPSWFKAYPWLEVSEYAKWSEVVSWSLPYYATSPQLSDQLNEQIEKWKKSSKSKKEYIEKVLRFIQDDIRYFGIEYGRNSHEPSDPSEVYSRLYGDCKDKSLLLTHILRKNSIDAFPALVSTEFTKLLEELLPSPGVFDHVIVYAKLGRKKYWLDPTMNYQHGDLNLISGLPYKKALILRKGEKKFNDIELTNNNDGIYIVKKYDVESYQKPVVMGLKYTFSGKEAEIMRRMMASGGEKAIAKNYFNYYARFHSNLEVKDDFNFSDDKKNNRIIMSGQFVVDDFFEMNSDHTQMTLSANYLRQFVALPNVIKRNSPLAQYHPIKVDQELIVEYPENLSWGFDLEPVSFVSDALTYKRQLQADKNKIRLMHTYESKSDYVPQEEVNNHVKILKNIDESLFFPVILNKMVGKREDRLKNALKSLMNKSK